MGARGAHVSTVRRLVHTVNVAAMHSQSARRRRLHRPIEAHVQGARGQHEQGTYSEQRAVQALGAQGACMGNTLIAGFSRSRLDEHSRGIRKHSSSL